MTDLHQVQSLLLRPRRRPLQQVVRRLVGGIVVLAVAVSIGGDLPVLKVAHFNYLNFKIPTTLMNFSLEFILLLCCAECTLFVSILSLRGCHFWSK